MLESTPVFHRGTRSCRSHLWQNSERPKTRDLIVPSDSVSLNRGPRLFRQAGFTTGGPSHCCCCCCWLSAAGSLHMSCRCPSPANTPGRTCGRVSVTVATASTIRAPEWCNDKKGPWLSVISSSISIYYPHRHVHRVAAHSGMQSNHLQGFPHRLAATRSPVTPLWSRVSDSLLCSASL